MSLNSFDSILDQFQSSNPADLFDDDALFNTLSEAASTIKRSSNTPQVTNNTFSGDFSFTSLGADDNTSPEMAASSALSSPTPFSATSKTQMAVETSRANMNKVLQASKANSQKLMEALGEQGDNALDPDQFYDSLLSMADSLNTKYQPSSADSPSSSKPLSADPSFYTSSFERAIAPQAGPIAKPAFPPVAKNEPLPQPSLSDDHPAVSSFNPALDGLKQQGDNISGQLSDHGLFEEKPVADAVSDRDESVILTRQDEQPIDPNVTLADAIKAKLQPLSGPRFSASSYQQSIFDVLQQGDIALPSSPQLSSFTSPTVGSAYDYDPGIRNDAGQNWGDVFGMAA
jgi:hypothetical protein